MDVGEVCDRLRRDYLEPPDELWTATRLTSSRTAANTSMLIDLDTLTFEEQQMFGPGVLVEVDNEQMAAVDLDGAALTVRRGVRGTEPADHDEGAELRIAPPYTRAAILAAVSESIAGLHPPLYAVQSATETVGNDGLVVLDSQALSVTAVRHADTIRTMAWQDLGEWESGRTLRVFDTDPYEQFTATRKPAPAGTKLWLTYRSRFMLPVSEDQSLLSLGVRNEWARLVVVQAAAQLLSTRSMSVAQQQFVSGQLRTEGYPVETPSRIRESLIRYYEYLMHQATASLAREHPQDVVFT